MIELWRTHAWRFMPFLSARQHLGKTPETMNAVRALTRLAYVPNAGVAMPPTVRSCAVDASQSAEATRTSAAIDCWMLAYACAVLSHVSVLR